MYVETVAHGTKELQLRVRPGVTACVARLIVRVVHCKFLFFGRRMLSRRSDIVVPTVTVCRLVSDTAVFVLKRDVKLQLTHSHSVGVLKRL